MKKNEKMKILDRENIRDLYKVDLKNLEYKI